jgi:hypothetical protein
MVICASCNVYWPSKTITVLEAAESDIMSMGTESNTMYGVREQSINMRGNKVFSEAA